MCRPTVTRAPAVVCAAFVICLASPGAADWENYGSSDRADRQDLALPACRANLDLEEEFDGQTSSEFTVDEQAVALNCELESWRRSLHTPGDPEEHEEAINAHLRGIMERIELGISVAACTSTNPRTPAGCFQNNVIARTAGHLTAYILNRYTERSWETATLDTARDLYRSTRWWQGLPTAGNSTLPLIGMRLLGGEVLDDPVLESRGIAELHFAHGRDIRQGVPEPMSRHYAGVTIGELELLRETDDPDLREMVENLLAAQLLVNAHNYLPGGQIGAPQDRKAGPVDDTLEVEGNNPHLLNHLNMVVHDPDLPLGIGHDERTLASDYTAPEVIRSIFLDKGDGYSFWYRGDAPTSLQDGAGYEGEWHYPSYGWQGFDGPLATDFECAPTQTITLAGGSAQMGIRYAPGGETGFSNGLFARDDEDSFSVYYHHQPRPDDDGQTSWDPLTDDQEWRYEKQSYRRMLHGRTVITLFEPDDEHSFLEYTIAHLPGAIGTEIVDCEDPAYTDGNSWLVRRHEGAWVAYLPLGEYTATTKDGGAWTFLEFDEGVVSGNISEIADGVDYDDAEDYCDDLATRNAEFDDDEAIAQVETTPPGATTPVTIQLDYQEDERAIDSGSGFVVQADDGFVDKGLMHVEPVGEVSWLTWNDEFELEVERAPHASVTLDFGDPTLPTPPQTLTVQSEAEVNATPIKLVWDHGIDDEGIVEYKVWRDDVEIGSLHDEDPGFSAASGAKAIYSDSTEPAGGGPAIVQYRVESVDLDDQHSLVKSMIKEVTVKTRPTAAVLTSAVAGVKEVALGWTPATDHVGIASQEIMRDGNVVASLGSAASSYVDTSVLPNQTYEYLIRAHDTVGLSADSNEESESTPVDNTPPSAPPNLNGTVTASTTIWWNSASDDWGVIGYQILRDEEPITETSLNYFFEVLPPGTYVYKVRARDWGLNLGPESPSKTLVVP